MVLNKSYFKAFLNALNSKDINYKEFIHVVKYLLSVVFNRGYYIPRITHSLELTAKKKKYYNTVFKVLAEYTSNSNISMLGIKEYKVLIKETTLEVKESEKDRISKFIGTGMMAIKSETLLPKMSNINITYSSELNIARFYIKDREGASEFIFNNFYVKELVPIKNKTSEQIMDIVEHPLHIDFHSHIKRVLNYNLLLGTNIVYNSRDNKKTLAYRFSILAKELNKIFDADINTFINWDNFLVKTIDNIIINEIVGEQEMIKVKISDIVPMDIVEASNMVIELKKLDATIDIDLAMYNVLSSKVVEIKNTVPERKNAVIHSFESFVPILNGILKKTRLAILEDSLPSMAGNEISRVFKLDLRRGV